MNEKQKYNGVRSLRGRNGRSKKPAENKEDDKVFEVLGTNRAHEPLIAKWELAAIVGIGLGSVALIGLLAWMSTR